MSLPLRKSWNAYGVARKAWPKLRGLSVCLIFLLLPITSPALGGAHCLSQLKLLHEVLIYAQQNPPLEPDPAPDNAGQRPPAEMPKCDCEISPASQERALTPAQKQAADAASAVGTRETGTDGRPARPGYYTADQINRKLNLLSPHFDERQIRTLMAAAQDVVVPDDIQLFAERFRIGDTINVRSKTNNFYQLVYNGIGWNSAGIIVIKGSGPNPGVLVTRIKLGESFKKDTIVEIRKKNDTVSRPFKLVGPVQKALLVQQVGNDYFEKLPWAELSDDPIEETIFGELVPDPKTTEALENILGAVNVPGWPTNDDAIMAFAKAGISFSEPVTEFETARFLFGSAFFVGNRLFVPTIVEYEGKKNLRVFYKSQSQGEFRLLPAINKGLNDYGLPGFDKGDTEYSLSPPAAIQAQLANHISRNFIHLDQDQADRTLRNILPVNTSLTKWQKYTEGKDHPSKAILARHNVVTPAVLGPVGFDTGKFGNPAEVTVQKPDDGADFAAVMLTYDTTSATSGKIKARVFNSKNGRWQWTFFTDLSNRTWISNVRLLAAKMTNFGLPAESASACVGQLLSPIWEYRDQAYFHPSIPRVEHDSLRSYVNNWPWIKNLKEIGRYYNEFNGAGTKPN